METFIVTVNLILNIVEITMLGFIGYYLMHLIKITRNPEKIVPGSDSARIREMAVKMDTAATELKETTDSTRAEFKRMVNLMEGLEGSVAAAGASSLRNEQLGVVAQRDRANVATDLAEAKLVLEDVALDLADSRIVIAGVAYELKAAQGRAEGVKTPSPAGTAADAAATSSSGSARKSAPRKKSP